MPYPILQRELHIYEANIKCEKHVVTTESFFFFIHCEEKRTKIGPKFLDLHICEGDISSTP